MTFYLSLAAAVLSLLTAVFSFVAMARAGDAEEKADAVAARLNFLEKWDPPQGRGEAP